MLVRDRNITLAQDLDPKGPLPEDLDVNRYIRAAYDKLRQYKNFDHLDPAFLDGHPILTDLHHKGLRPVPLNNKAMIGGSSVKFHTYIHDWKNYPTIGIVTGVESGVGSFDIDDHVLFKIAVDHGALPNLLKRWEDLKDALVSCHGCTTPDMVRRGEGRGKLFFFVTSPKLAGLMKTADRESLRTKCGFELFFGQGCPAIFGRHPSGEEYRYEGTPFELDHVEWLVALIEKNQKHRTAASLKPSRLRNTRKPHPDQLSFVSTNGDGDGGPGPNGSTHPPFVRPELEAETADSNGAPTLPILQNVDTKSDDQRSIIPVPGRNGRRDAETLTSDHGRERDDRDDNDEEDEDKVEYDERDAENLAGLIETAAGLPVSPPLDPDVVDWRFKIWEDTLIAIGHCPSDEHDSGTDDLLAGFNKSGHPHIKCKHAKCSERNDLIRRLLGEQFEPERRAAAEVPQKLIVLTPIAEAILASIQAGEVTLHRAPCGAGKTYANTQVAALLARQGREVIYAQPTIQLVREVIMNLETIAPDLIATGKVARIYGAKPNDDDQEAEGEPDESSHKEIKKYPLTKDTLLTVCTEVQLMNRGFSKYTHGYWTRLWDALLQGDRPKIILLDELGTFLRFIRRKRAPGPEP